MAEQGRSGLNGLVQANLPTNNAKQISATKHREVLADYSDSKFNKVDDDAFDVNFDNNGTDLLSENVGNAIIELNNRVRPFLGGGVITIGDMQNEAVGTVKNIQSGTFNDCEVSAIDGGLFGGAAVEYEVSMPDVGTSDYKIILDIISKGNVGSDNTLTHTTRARTNTSFRFVLSELGSVAQNIDVDILLVKRF